MDLYADIEPLAEDEPPGPWAGPQTTAGNKVPTSERAGPVETTSDGLTLKPVRVAFR